MKMIDSINQIVIDVLNGKVASKDLTPDKRVVQDLGADSMQLLEIALSIAAEFEIDVPSEEVINLKTMQDIYMFVASKKGLTINL